MSGNENFEINYLGKNFNNIYHKPSRQRSIKQKLAIVVSFISVLVFLPMIVFGLSKISNSPKIAANIEVKPQPTKATPIKVNKEPNQTETNKVTITEPQKTSVLDEEIINNDSYWKISKRVCGTGKYYLSIMSQNNGKALYQGERVKVDCSI